MYSHAQDRVSRPSTVPSSIHSTHHYVLTSQTDSGLLYDATGNYPPTRSAPLSIPRISSSSLATALDPAPEPDFSRRSVSSSNSVEHTDERLNSSAFANFGAASGAGGMEYHRNMHRQVPNPPTSLQPEFQLYQDDDGQRRTPSRSHSRFSAIQADASLASTSDAYVLPHDATTYIQSDEAGWPPAVPFPGYSSDPSITPNAPAIACSGFPVFPNDYAFNSASVGGIYGPSTGVGEWTYTSANSPFHAQASDEMYLGIGSTSPTASAGGWFGSSLEASVRIQSGSSVTFLDDPVPRPQFEPLPDSAAGAHSGASNSGSSASEGASDYLGQRQTARQSDIGDDDVASVQERQNSPARRPIERIQQSVAHADSHPITTPSLPVSHISLQGQTALRSQHVKTKSRQLQGHDASMPPPPLPARAHAPASDPSKRASHHSVSRRHSVAVPPSNQMDQNRDVSPTSSSASASVRPSSAAPGSSSSSTLGSDEIATTPRLATLTLNDAAWALDQKAKRSGLEETFRVMHGRDPPDEMRILQTSAIERSEKNDAVLLGSPLEGKVLRNEENNLGQSMQNKSEAVGVFQPPPTSSEEMSDEEVFGRPLVNWTLAQPGCEMAASSMLGPAQSPISPTTTDELVIPSGIRRIQMPYPFAAPANPSTLNRVLSVIRHDGHLPTHVSGLGGTFVEAYDGRSYLPDDCERGDRDHVPLPSAGARSGDHPALASFLPHPLAKRGQVWHDLMSPTPVEKSTFGKQRVSEESQDGENDDKGGRTDGDASPKNLEKIGVKKEEQGEGWGFPEGGSHGPDFLHHGKDKDAPNTRQKLKLSTEKKTPPKMACHFCRNRKIACGMSKCGDPTICNQCERRNLRCIFPTISRRGMRTRGPRSAHTVDGMDEVDKDSAGREGSSEPPENPQDSEAVPSGSGSSKKTRKAKKSSEKGTEEKEKEKTKGKGRGKGKRKSNGSEERRDGLPRQTDDVVGDDDPGGGSEMDVDRIPGRDDDPLASLAAEINWSQRRRESPTITPPMQFDATPSMAFSTTSSALSTSSLTDALHFHQTTFENSFPASVPGDAYLLHVSPSPGPFTTTPLQRRNVGGDTSGPCP